MYIYICIYRNRHGKTIVHVLHFPSFGHYVAPPVISWPVRVAPPPLVSNGVNGVTVSSPAQVAGCGWKDWG